MSQPPMETQVRCYSGHAYAERPVAFCWDGEDVTVDAVLASWREPVGPVFHVRTARGAFRLAYEVDNDRWSVTAIL